jgi:alpha-tubulin suppressor-like RCC1 family protein
MNGQPTRPVVPQRLGADSDWVSIAADAGHFTALKRDGSLWTWGFSAPGYFGDGTDEIHAEPARIGTDADWAQASPGSWHTAAVKADGSLWVWGWGGQGQLGDGMAFAHFRRVH